MKISQEHSGQTKSLSLDVDVDHSGFSSPTAVHHSFALRAMKRICDITVSLFFFAAFGWLYLLIWIGVMLSSGRPGIYHQPRYGKDGKVFRFFKFRSMVLDSSSVLELHLKNDPVAKKQWDDFQKLEDDPRITKFGKFIRKTSLDELPQFWNVLRGDMSLVGPRPCMVSQKELYGPFWEYYCTVRPGITGLWQVSGRNTLSYKMRVQLDVQYVKELSIGNDAGIFLKTLLVVATGHGSR